MTVRQRQSCSTYIHIKLNNSYKMKKKIDSYFSRVTANRHACNMYVGGETFDMQFQAEKEAKDNRQREIDDRVKERREAAKRMRPVERTIPTEAEDSDHDEELTFADLTAGDSGSDSDSD